MSGEPQAIFSETYRRGNRREKKGRRAAPGVDASGPDSEIRDVTQEESCVNVSARERRPGLGRQAV
jgi:hypothetical protein